MALLVHLLAAAFGMGSWLAVNGLWVELPLIVNTLPEGWDLPSYLTVIIQLANVGPLLVTLMHQLRPGYLRETAVIYAILAIGVLACVLLAIFWRVTTVVGGAPHSTAFFILTFFLSLVDCTSSVTFLPFMSGLPAKYITTYFIGEGLSGSVPGLVALAQGVGMASCVNTTHNLTGGGDAWTPQTQYQPPNFSPEVFFSFLAAMMCVSLAAFIALRKLPRVSLDLAALVPELSAPSLTGLDNPGLGPDGAPSLTGLDNPGLEPDGPPSLTGLDNPGLEPDGAPSLTGLDNPGLEPDGPPPLRHETRETKQKLPVVAKAHFSVYQLGFIYFLVVWVNMAANGLLPSVQTYSCMPYGNRAYHLSAALSSVANPAACVVAMFFPNRSLLFLGVLGVLGSAFGSYNMAMAALSPCPLLQSSPVGLAIIVLSWVFFTGTFCYVKAMVGVILRDKSHSALVWCGAASQLGSLVGSVTMFPLVNTYKLFKSGDYCNTKCPL